jgi:hypothetical protein
LSTTQNFTTPGTAYTLQQIGGLPAATVQSSASGNYLILATTPKFPVAGNDNSISFVTNDVGTYNQATASWYFRVTPNPGNGVGMSFALLNTANYGTSGGASTTLPQQGLYNGSVAFGFDTTNNAVYLSFNGAIVSAISLQSLILASNQFIHASATIDFVNATVSLSLTPSGGSPDEVFDVTSVPGLTPYQSRVSLEAKNITTTGAETYAEFDLTNINVQYIGLRQPGTISFSSSSYVVPDNQSTAQIDIVRIGGSAGSFTIGFATADGTARNGVNYEAVSGDVPFGEGVTLQTVNIPIINDHLDDGNKTVNLYIGNPTGTAPIASPIVATLTIINTNLPAPTVSPTVQLVYAAHTRRVEAFRLQFSQPMDPTSAQTVSNYEVLLPPAYKNGPVRVVSLSQAVLDPSGLFVTLYRASLGQHLTKFVQIVVRGKPSTGLRGTNNGTFLAGTGGVSGTDAALTVSI